MRFTEFSKFTIRPHLFENKQQYKQIVDSVVNAGLIDQASANELLTKVRQTLKRADRIIWWLRWRRISTAHQAIALKIGQEKKTAVAPVSDAEKRESEEKIQELKRLFKKITKRDYDTIETRLFTSFERLFNLQVLSAHWSTMFEQSPQVNAVEWEANLEPIELLRRLEEAEEEWKEKQAQELEMEPDDQIIIDYGKYAWVKLDREYCEAEGRAMGHCGNTATPKEGDRILSFRTKVSDTKQKPHLTFILDKNGYLGEMKGRGNDKPSEKYHPYIIDLLQKDFVKGIKGGGYMPQNNFSLYDLEEEQRTTLIEQKPELGSSADILRIKGIEDPLFYKKLEAELNAYDIFYSEIDPENNRVIIDTAKSVAEIDIFEKYLDNTNLIDKASKLMTGDMIGDIYDYPRDYIKMIMEDNLDDLYNSLDPEYQKGIEKFVKENYSDDWDWDEDSLEAIVSNVDELESAFMSATRTGKELGDEAEMISDFEGWMGNNGIQYDSYTGKFFLSLSSPDVSNAIHDAIQDGDGDDIDYYFFDYFDIGDFEPPYYGWDGFDTDAAKERLRDELADEDIVEI